MAYDWPGNVRELRNVLQRVAILNSTPVLEAAHVDHLVSLPEEQASPGQERNETNAPSSGARTIEEMEQKMIIATLDAQKGSRKDTARLLGITTRTLSNKLRTYRLMGIDVPVKRAMA
ncbi:MAG: helix-turn-helix domain-containing protein [Planctomycetota bacterium]